MKDPQPDPVTLSHALVQLSSLCVNKQTKKTMVSPRAVRRGGYIHHGIIQQLIKLFISISEHYDLPFVGVRGPHNSY